MNDPSNTHIYKIDKPHIMIIVFKLVFWQEQKEPFLLNPFNSLKGKSKNKENNRLPDKLLWLCVQKFRDSYAE